MNMVLLIICFWVGLAAAKSLPNEPYGETPWMDQRIFNPSIFQTQNMLDKFKREVDQTLPYNGYWVYGESFRAVPSFMGVVRPELQFEILRKQTELVMGNEVGDPLYSELNPNVKVQNRTPMIGFSIFYPDDDGEWQASFEQVDHFGTKDKVYREGVIDEEVDVKEVNESPRAWFGLNLPHFSFLNFGRNYHSKNYSHSMFFKKGWFWAQNPYTGAEVPTELNQMASILSSGGFRFEHVIQKFVESPKGLTNEYWANDAKVVWKGRVGFRKGLSLGGHVNYNSNIDDHAHLIPFFNLDYGTEQFKFVGENGGGLDFFYTKDTLKWQVGKDSSLMDLKAKSYVNWSFTSSNHLNPMLTKSQFTHGKSYRAFQSSKAWFHFGMKSGSFKKINLLGHDLKVDFWLESYLHKNALYFKVDSLKEESGRILRDGHFENLSSDLFGLKGNVFFDFELMDSLDVNLSITGEDFYGQGWKKIDFRPPRKNASLGIKYKLMTGLQIFPTWVYQSDYYVRGWGASFKVKEHIESNIKIEQVLIAKKWSVSLHMLNYLETGIKEHPNGAPNRFRVFVGSKYLF
jgi:hypothetical protein